MIKKIIHTILFIVITLTATAQKVKYTEWVKSTNCFKGFSSRIGFGGLVKNKFSSDRGKHIYYIQIRNDYDKKVSVSANYFIAGERFFYGRFTILPGGIYTTTPQYSTVDSKDVKIEINDICFSDNPFGCSNFSSHGTCYAVCDEGRTNIPANCGEGFQKNRAAYYRQSGNNLFYDFSASSAYDQYQDAWSLGDDTAALFLGFVYLIPDFERRREWGGKLVVETYSPAKARAYFDTACRVGNTTGYYGLGQLYEQGLGVTKDTATAISFYTKGAARANPCCLNALIAIYTKEGAYNNPAKAKECQETLVYLGYDKKPVRCRPEDYKAGFYIIN